MNRLTHRTVRLVLATLLTLSALVAIGTSTAVAQAPDNDSVQSPVEITGVGFHYEQDTSAGHATWDYAYQTCTAIRSSGNSCDAIKQAGSGHTVPIGATGPWWVPEIGPFLWHHLGLHDLAG